MCGRGKVMRVLGTSGGGVVKDMMVVMMFLGYYHLGQSCNKDERIRSKRSNLDRCNFLVYESIDQREQ